VPRDATAVDAIRIKVKSRRTNQHRKVVVTMFLRKCRKCAIGAVAAGAACTLCAEIAAAMADHASRNNFYIAVDVGADQPDDNQREPMAPMQTSALVIRQVTAVANGRGIAPPVSYSTPFFRWRDLDDDSQVSARPV
jgi:hypothetical protein